MQKSFILLLLSLYIRFTQSAKGATCANDITYNTADNMKTTIKYTKNLSNFDTNKIPIEQQICLMKASDTVKEKASKVENQ